MDSLFHTLQVRDWYVESFRDLRTFAGIKDAQDEVRFTELLRHIYRRHANVVPVMAKVCYLVCERHTMCLWPVFA